MTEFKIIKPDYHYDERGYFVETWNKGVLPVDFVQDNESSSGRGIVRGLHFQKEHPQAKLVRVVRGSVFDVAVDLRYDSPNFGKWYGGLLSDENRFQFFIPRGFAHGFMALSTYVVFQYKCDDFYYPKDQHGIHWQSVDIPWPILDIPEYVLSEKDKVLPKFDYNIKYF